MSEIQRINNRALMVTQKVIIALCFIITFTNAEGSVREMMAEEVTSFSSLYDFYTKHNSPYEKRYIFQYAPEYLLKLDVSEIPAWLTIALDSALSSSYVPLTIAAIRCIGDLKIEAFSGKLVNAFFNTGKKADLALSFRVNVLETMKKLEPSSKMEENIGLLLKNFPKERIGDPDFTALMETTMIHGVNAYMPYLDAFEARINDLINSSGQYPDNKYDLNRIKQLINRTKNSIASKEVLK